MNANYQPNSIQPAQSDYQRISDLLRKRVTRRSGLSMVEFAETTVVTAGSKKGQKFDLRFSPYARRPLELMDPASIMQLVILMFPAQSTKSVIGQLVAAYYSKELPSEILYAMADKESMRKTMERRLVPLLESVGVRFVTQSVSKTTRKTGDVTFSKEFDGGNLDGVTANSTAALAAETKRVLIGDELGKWKRTIGTEGTPWAQAWARLKAWLDEKKGLAISTPTDEETCLIFELFLTGTQEEWFVPCPKCGEMQVLTVRDRDGFGLDWRTKRGRIIESSVVYICKACGKGFKEKHKFDIQQNGEWRQPPGVEPINRYTASFHLHSLNSMFESWLEIASIFEKGLEDPVAKKDYDNLAAGLPSRQVGSRVKSEVVMQNRGEYPHQTVPDGVVFLTMGADVQAGADRWQEYTEEELQQEVDKARKEGDIDDKKFPRIELEIYGSGPSYRGWSIDYQILYGKVDNAFSGAFEKLYEYGLSIQEKNGAFGFKRESDGRLFPLECILIDSGHNSTTVYNFSHRWVKTFPSKGDRIVKPSKDQMINNLHSSNFVKFKKSQVDGGNTTLYTIGTKIYKKLIYTLLNVQRTEDDIQPANFQDFPREYGSRYFDGLTAEEKLHNGEYDNKGRYNEPIDCRVYSMCAADIYLDQEVKRWKEWYKTEHKYNEQQLEQINSRYVIEELAKRAGIDPRFLITKSNQGKK